MVTHKTKGLRIATRCTTIDQFVAAFHRFVDAKTVFISTLNPRSVGLETAFSIDLADNTPALRGIGVVIESWTTPQNPYGRPGLRLEIRRLTTDSEPVFDKLQFANEAAPPPPIKPVLQVFVAKPGVQRPLGQPAPLGIKVPVIPAPLTPKPKLELEQRTPGSELVLPANPLMNIDDESLAGFVDCTLFEETANYFGEQPIIEDPHDPVAAPPLLAPRRVTIPIPLANTLAKPSPLPIVNKLTPPMGASPLSPVLFGKGAPPVDRTLIPPEASSTAHYYAEQLKPAPAPPPPPLPSKPWLSPETAEMLDLEPDPSIVQPLPAKPEPQVEYSEQTYPTYNQRAHASDSYGVSAPPPEQHLSAQFAAQPYRPPQHTSKRRLVIGASAAATATIAIALLAAAHSSSTSSTAQAAPAPTLVASNSNHVRVTAPEPQQQPDRAVADAQPTTETAAAPAPDAGDTTVVGKGPCKIAISTTPAGSLISIDGDVVGPSPLTVAGPCAKRKITVAHPRYAPADRLITPKPEDSVDITLMRPTHNLFVDSQPPGAVVSIDGHRAGTSPTMVKVMGFTTLTLKIEKPGWKPTTKKLYSKTAVDRLSVKLGR